MVVHLIPYVEVFVSVRMSLDEATAVSDALALAAASGSEVGEVAGVLQKELEAAIDRAGPLMEKRGLK